MADDDKKLDELLRRAKMTGAQAGAGQKAGDNAGTGAGDFVKNIEEVQQAAKVVNSTAKIATESGKAAWSFLKPLWENPVSQWGWKHYKKIIDKFCYTKDKETGERKLSYGRSGVLALATYTAIAAVLPFMPGGQAVNAVVVNPAVDVAVMVKDAARMQLSYNEKETFYLNRESQTSIDREADSYMVKGSTTLESDAKNSVYFVIKPGFLHSQWNLKHNGSLLYNTSTVAGAIPTGDVAKCEVTSYGSRNPILLYLGAKPVLLEAKCESTKASFNGAVGGTQIVHAAAQQQQVKAPAPTFR